MIGWHYTTPEHHEAAMLEGLKPLPVHPRHYDEFAVADHIPSWEVVWVFCEPRRGDEHLGMFVFTMVQHASPVTRLLKLEYPKRASVRALAEKADPGSSVCLRHTLGIDRAGRFGHDKAPMDLVIETIPPECIGEWDLTQDYNLSAAAAATGPLIMTPAGATPDASLLDS